MKTVRFIWLVPLLITSCFQEDEIVPPHEAGDLTVGVTQMGPYYGRQVYYDLAGNMEVSSNEVSAWDLSFESASGGWEIRLNSSMFMYAGNSFDTLFSADLSPAGLDMLFDASTGNPDSTAIGNWTYETKEGTFSKNHVYLLDMGSDELGVARGTMKVQFGISGEDYTVRFGKSGSDTSVVIKRDPSRRIIQFSFKYGVVELEPPAETWSLLFTRYTTMLVTNEGEYYPYIVAGVLLNPQQVAAAPDTLKEFDNLILDDTLALHLRIDADVIGYSWKEYDFDGGFYTIVPGKHFVIRDRDGFYYKLRFIDFYNDSGEKGFPRFEFIRL